MLAPVQHQFPGSKGGIKGASGYGGCASRLDGDEIPQAAVPAAIYPPPRV